MFEFIDPSLFAESPGDDVLWMRQSTVGSWELCPARVMLSDDPGFKALPSEAMSFGTLVHEMGATDLTDGLQNWTIVDVMDLWDTLVTDEYGVSVFELAAEEMIRDGAVEAIGANQLWRVQVVPTLPDTDPVVETRLEAPLGVLPSGRRVWLHGTGDVLYPDSHVGVDWKTAGRGWKEGKADLTGQAAAYTYLAWVAFSEWISEWRYWVYDRQKVEWAQWTTSRTEQQVDAWLRHAFGIAKAIDAGAVMYTPVDSTFGKMSRGWWCSAKYCGAWEVCKGKYLADDVDESATVEVTWS